MGTGIGIGVDMVININEQNAVPTDVQAQHFAAPEVV
jgi:hypothetical protein